MLAVKVTFWGIPNSLPQAGPISGGTDSVPITFSFPSSLLRAEKYSRGKSLFHLMPKGCSLLPAIRGSSLIKILISCHLNMQEVHAKFKAELRKAKAGSN